MDLSYYWRGRVPIGLCKQPMWEARPLGSKPKVSQARLIHRVSNLATPNDHAVPGPGGLGTPRASGFNLPPSRVAMSR